MDTYKILPGVKDNKISWDLYRKTEYKNLGWSPVTGRKDSDGLMMQFIATSEDKEYLRKMVTHLGGDLQEVK